MALRELKNKHTRLKQVGQIELRKMGKDMNEQIEDEGLVMLYWVPVVEKEGLDGIEGCQEKGNNNEDERFEKETRQSDRVIRKSERKEYKVRNVSARMSRFSVGLG